MQYRAAAGTLSAVLFLSSLAPLASTGDETELLPSGERANGYVEFLADDALEGRKPGTEGYRMAADWAAGRFQEWGLAPAGENGTYFQNVPVRPYTLRTGAPRLSVAGREFLLDDEDFSLSSLSTPSTVNDVEVIFVGYGISAPDKEYDEYAGLDVEGKVVLCFKGSPHDAPETSGWFAPADEGEKKAEKDRFKEESKDSSKIKTAYDKGAAAVLLYEPDEEESGGRRYWSRSRGSELETTRDYLCFTIQERVFRAIMRTDPQESTSGFGRRIADLRRSLKKGEVHSRATGVPVTLAGYDSSTPIGEGKEFISRNVIAKIEGTDPTLEGQYVILGAHLDHVGMSNGYVRNGADDNASGSALTLEVARTLAEGGFQPRRTMVFCLWTAEEMGLIGSKYYVANPCDGVTMDQVVTYINADMVGLGDGIGAPGGLNFQEIWEVLTKDQDPELMKIVKASTGGPGGSDHSPFIVLGIESLALMTRGGVGHPDYHRPEDDAAKIDPLILGQTCRFAMQGLMNVANETETELLIPNRLTIYEAVQLRIANINPALEDSSWSTVKVKAKDAKALDDEIHDEMLKLIRKSRASSDEENPRPSRSVTLGVADLKPFGGDLRLLELAAELHGFSRLDIHGDDGVWIVEGKLTDAGQKAVKELEKLGLVIHLVSPTEALFDDFLSAAGKPFLVTGKYVLDESRADRVVQKGVLLGVDLDPKKVDEFLVRVNEVKNQLGKRELLVISLTSTEGLDEAKRPLYLGLLEQGWAPREIRGTRRRAGGITGGNLGAIGATPSRSRRR